MQLRIYISIMFLCFLLDLQVIADDIEALYRRYKDSVFNGEAYLRYDQRWVTPEMRDALIAKARQLADDPDPKTRLTAQSILIRLGDEASLQAVMDRFHKGDYGIPESDALLPYLVNEIYTGETGIVRDHMSPMDIALKEMYNIIGHYASFPEKTREWALSTRHLLSFDRGPGCPANQLMRLWWEHNKDAVIAKQYANATWTPSAEEQSNIVSSFKPEIEDNLEELHEMRRKAAEQRQQDQGAARGGASDSSLKPSN